MKKFLGLMGIAALSLTATVAQAQSVYGDVAYQMIDASLSTNPAVVRGIVGYQFHPNYSAEGLVGLNLRDGKETTFGVTTNSKVDRLMGVYAKGSYKVNDAFEMYGRLGAVSYKVKATAGTVSASDSGSSVSYGVGASYYVTPSTSINVDYMDFGDLEGGIALGLKYSF